MKLIGYLSLSASLFIWTSCRSSHNHMEHDQEMHENHVHIHNHNNIEHVHEHVQGHDHEHQHVDASHEHNHIPITHDESHEDGIITMSPADADFLGVSVSKVTPSDFNEVLHVNGSFVQRPDDISKAVSLSSGIVNLSSVATPGTSVSKGTLLATINGQSISGGDLNAAAYQKMIAAKKELERITPLHVDGIVSTRDFNAAEAAYKQALSEYSGSQNGSKVVSNIIGTISEVLVQDGEYVESGTVIATIAKNGSLLLKVNVPVKSISHITDLKDANIQIAGTHTVYSLNELNGQRVDGVPATMLGAYIPVYFSLSNNGSILPGMPVDVFLKTDTRHDVISVPVTAVSEQQGANFVFERLDEDCYKKIPVKLGNNDGKRVEILSGLKGDEEIVTDGMIFIKLAESNGAVPEGHSHSH